MPKRMTVTEKWDDPWYLALSPQAKLIFEYLRDKCDHIGIWKVNIDSLRKEAKFSPKVDIEKHINELNEVADEIGEDEKIEWFPGKRYIWICNFLKVQYGGILNVKSSMHRTIFREMGKHWNKNVPKKLSLILKFYENEVFYCTPTLQIGYNSTVETYRNGKGNGNGNEKGKESIIETEIVRKPLGMDVVMLAHEKALKDQRWIEGVRIGHNILVNGELEKWLHRFSISIAQDTIENFSDATYRKMFSGWLGARKAKGDKLENIEKEQLPTGRKLVKL
jgi:hypothetical protein